MTKKTDTEQITVKAVLAEAERLRGRASRERQADPWARPYDPTDAAARTLSQQLGPERAILTLRQRADDARAEYREQTELAERARKKHIRRMKLHDAETRQRRSGMTPGERVDEVLGRLALVSEMPAAQLGGSVKSGKPGSKELRSTGDRYGSARQEVLLLIAKLEDRLESSRRRMVELEDAA